jgi:hypothetical protein
VLVTPVGCRELPFAACGLQKGEHYHIDDGYDAMNNVYACGLLEDINIEPEQDATDPSKINIRIKVEEVEPRSMEVRRCDSLGREGGGGRACYQWRCDSLEEMGVTSSGSLPVPVVRAAGQTEAGCSHRFRSGCAWFTL